MDGALLVKSVLVATCFFAVNVAKESEKSESVELKNIQFPEEWHLWKAKHEKKYDNPKHELSRHLVWLSNKAYIEEHNKYADALGYGLKMNKFGDLVYIK